MNELRAPLALQPAACRHNKIEKASHVYNICHPTERRREEKRRKGVVRRMFLGVIKAFDMIRNKKYDNVAEENKN